jgi:hypothetical protein
MQPIADPGPFLQYGALGVLALVLVFDGVSRMKREARWHEMQAQFLQVLGEIRTGIALSNQQFIDSQRAHLERFDRLTTEHRDIQNSVNSVLSRRGIGE